MSNIIKIGKGYITDKESGFTCSVPDVSLVDAHFYGKPNGETNESQDEYNYRGKDIIYSSAFLLILYYRSLLPVHCRVPLDFIHLPRKKNCHLIKQIGLL